MAVHQPVPLAEHHVLADFDCGELVLDDWLKQRARKNESRFSRTYVVGDGHRVIGYYSIAASSIERGATPKKLRRNAPDVIPIAVIGRLAVDRAYTGRGLGADLLFDALRRIAGAARSVGIAMVLVHAKSDEARRFYLARGEFIEFPVGSRTLFLPIEIVQDLLQ